MPRMNGMGPEGQGPLTGRGNGPCGEGRRAGGGGRQRLCGRGCGFGRGLRDGSGLELDLNREERALKARLEEIRSEKENLGR